MGKTLIKVSCVDQRLVTSYAPLVASGGMSEDEVDFSFCPLWDGFTKTAVFYRDGGVVYHVLLSDDKATIPQEVLKDEGTLYFGVLGVKDGVRRTSEVLRYKIKAGAITTGTTPPEPTPDIYSQLLTKITTAETTLGNRVSAVEKFTIVPEEYELSGNPVKLDNYEGMPMDVVSTFAPKQAGSGDPSPTNIRAITGWTGAKLTRCGKNLCPGFESGGYENGTGKTFDSTSYYRTKKIPITEGATYTHSTSKGWNPNDIHFWDKDEVHLGQYSSISALNNRPAGAAYVAFNYYQQDITWVQLELGSTATAYEPYQGETFSATFGQTVYGGTLNWNTGVLTVDRNVVSFNGSEEWGMDSSGVWAGANGNGFYTKSVNYKGKWNTIPLCSEYKGVGRQPESGFANNTVCLISGGAQIEFIRTEYTELNDWKSYLAARASAGTPVQVCYKLSTPTTIQLAAHEIAALRGVNMLFGDGTLTVSGRKDILWLTEKLTQRIKTLESAIVAMGGNV